MVLLGCGGVLFLSGAAGAVWWYLRAGVAAVTAPEPVAAVAPEPEPSPLRLELDAGIAALQAGDAAGAVLHLDRVLEEDAGNTEALLWRAKAHTKLGQEDRAAADYAALLVIEPDHADALYGHAWCLHRLSQDDAALADTERLVSLAPSRGEAWALRAECLWQLGKLEAAEQSAVRACELGHAPGCTAVERFRSIRR